MTKTAREFAKLQAGQSQLVFGYMDEQDNIYEIDVSEIEDFDAIEDFINRSKKANGGTKCA